jgi:hypothetical protein
MLVQVSRATATALLLTLVVASCGGRTDPTSYSIKVGDFPAEVLRTFCETFGACCESAGRPFDSARCVAVREREFQAALPVPESSAEKRIPARCLNEVASAARQCGEWTPCTEFLEATREHAKLGEGCAGTCFALQGTLACGGQAGLGTKDCFVSDGLFCSVNGRCEPRAAAGQPCQAGEFSCANSTCEAGFCAAPLAPGADCTGSPDRCADGFVCEAAGQFCTSAAFFQGMKCTCSRARPDGGACTDDRQCASAPCSEGRCQPRAVQGSELAALCGG